jgi:microcystin-dependent protein
MPTETGITSILGYGTLVPKFGIILWAGALADIPLGWALCDGNWGTPDLRDRFVIGAGNLAVGTTGGEASHVLSEAEMPAHVHSSLTTVGNQVTWGGSGYHPTGGSTGSTGGGGAHENRPPYYALAYIMKT